VQALDYKHICTRDVIDWPDLVLAVLEGPLLVRGKRLPHGACNRLSELGGCCQRKQTQRLLLGAR
jgi:hypothetical protein